ncbi:hypothetical protein OH492_17430 [Vibrio chagasii]|nr:hypothetical protein [Vibrio chagasii]
MVPDSKYRNQQHLLWLFTRLRKARSGRCTGVFGPDQRLSNIIRAIKLGALRWQYGQELHLFRHKSVKHDDEMIRLGVVQGPSGFPFTDRAADSVSHY